MTPAPDEAFVAGAIEEPDESDRLAEEAARLGQLYRKIQSEQYACPDIFCTFPHDGNCWCFNTALAQYIADHLTVRHQLLRMESGS